MCHFVGGKHIFNTYYSIISSGILLEGDSNIGQFGVSHGHPLVNGACYCASTNRGHAIYIEMLVSMPLNYLKNHIGIQRCYDVLPIFGML
jgi:hypothetical protein